MIMEQNTGKSVAQSRGLNQMRKTRLELESVDTSFVSELVLIDPQNITHIPVHAIYQHSQQRCLCELSQDGNSLYFTSTVITEELTKDNLALYDPHADVWSVPTLRRLDLKTGKFHSVAEADVVTGVVSLGLTDGLVVVNNYRTAIIFPENGESVLIPEERQLNHICPYYIKHGGIEKILIIMSLEHGASYTVLDYPLNSNKDTEAAPQSITYNGIRCNHFCVGEYNSEIYAFGASNKRIGPLIFKLNRSTFELESTPIKLLYGDTNISPSMGSCQTQGPLFAMGTSDGRCFIWNFETTELLAVMYNIIDLLKQSNKIEIEAHRFSNNGILNVKFNPSPKLKHILVFAEASNYVHVVDTRSFKQQLINVGKDNHIAGLCFSHDGTMLYVATRQGIKIYNFYLKATLLELCSLFIMENVDRKEDFGWKLGDLPSDLRHKLNLP